MAHGVAVLALRGCARHGGSTCRYEDVKVKGTLRAASQGKTTWREEGKFSNVSILVHLLYTVTVVSTYERAYLGTFGHCSR
jgi:hypothetical protein